MTGDTYGKKSRDHYYVSFDKGKYIILKFISFIEGLLQVLWQVSFGCWVTWSISSWQEYYKRVSSFSILQNFNFWMIKFTVTYTKKKYLALANLILSLKNFQDWKVNIFLSFNLRGLRAFIFAESSELSCWETEKEVLLPITQIWERRHSDNTLVSLK